MRDCLFCANAIADHSACQCEGAQRHATEQSSGLYRGRHYSAWRDEIKALGKAGRLEELETLLAGCAAAARNEAIVGGYAVASGYHDQLATLYRKQKRHADELAILEQASTTDIHASKRAARIEALRVLLARKADVE